MGCFGWDFYESFFLPLSLRMNEAKSQCLKIDYLESRHVRPEESDLEKRHAESPSDLF
jgi:hypothetical protein